MKRVAAGSGRRRSSAAVLATLAQSQRAARNGVSCAATLRIAETDTGTLCERPVARGLHLDRAHFSPGVIDGRANKNTALALRWFQKSRDLPATSSIDSDTYARLLAVAGNRDTKTATSVFDG